MVDRIVQGTQRSFSGTIRSQSGTVRIPQGLVRDPPTQPELIAFWDWTGATPFVSQVGGHTLVDGAGSSVTISDAGPSGKAATFDGSSDYLVIPAASVGSLNIGGNGSNQVTICAWVDRDETGISFIAGCWQEDDADPKRQYGLFVDLPEYGGDERVCGHVSFTGEPTPGYPFSRDYSANMRPFNNSRWEFIAFVCNNIDVRSYLNCMLDIRPSFTDNEGQTYSKNPYLWTDGLNPTPCDFTVGAVKLTAGMSNHLQGKIGPLSVYRGALSLAEVTAIMRADLAPEDPVYLMDFFAAASSNARLGGWQCASGATVYTDIGASNFEYFGINLAGAFQYLARGATTTNVPIVGWSPDLAGVSLSEITSVSFRLNSGVTNSLLRLVIKSGDLWYATDETFDLSVAGISGSDWTNAVVKTFTFDLTAAKWRDLTFTPGSALSLAGSARSQDIPDGTLQNVGFYSPANPAAALRIDDLKVFV